ncbi:MAG: riboflavin kinase [Bifidobacterium sp.]|nr:riboflavin kinase [Bifidobacterium sp.]
MHIIELTPDASGTVAWPVLSTSKKSVVTVGVFDGVHRGHLAVLERTVELARKLKCLSVAVMFDPRPAFVHAYADGQGIEPDADAVDDQELTGVDERQRAMDGIGLDFVLVVRYTLAFADKSFRFFLGQLVGKLGMRTLVLGEDARMGARNEGDIKKIRTLADATGVFELDVVKEHGDGHVRIPVRYEPTMPAGRGEPADPTAGMSKAELRAYTKQLGTREVRRLSSSNIRYLLSQGRVKDANALLGHRHGVEGTVVHGEERGRAIGFPTANVEQPTDGYLPVDGVYAGWLVDLGPADEYDRVQEELRQPSEEGVSQPYTSGGVESRLAAHSPYRWPAAISIGTKPTFNEATGRHERVLEAYALTDDWLDLYGHRVRVEFSGYLRPQEKFDSADDLAAELARNAQEVADITAAER